MVTASLHYYPRIQGGLFIEGELGLSDYRMLKGLQEGLLFESADTTYFSGIGVGGAIGLGWDVSIGRMFALSPRAVYLFGGPRALHSPNGARVATGWRQHVLEAGVEFVIHSPGIR
jgi:hypothetical protein